MPCAMARLSSMGAVLARLSIWLWQICLTLPWHFRASKRGPQVALEVGARCLHVCACYQHPQGQLHVTSCRKLLAK